MRGVPLRIEVGPKDVEKGTVALARRDRPGKEGKAFVTQDHLSAQVSEMLDQIQAFLYERAISFRKSNTHAVSNYSELTQVVEDGWAMAWWCGSAECEARVKEDTKATTRCIPLEQPGGTGVCVVCGERADQQVVFSRRLIK